jgi:hypothetical protein
VPRITKEILTSMTSLTVIMKAAEEHLDEADLTALMADLRAVSREALRLEMVVATVVASQNKK